MNANKLILVFLIVQSICLSQSLIVRGDFGNFTAASAMDIDLNGNLYISDLESNSIFKFDSLGILIESIGGYGWDAESFDNPADIFTNTLSVYVADKNNNRIQRFDKDLNYLSQFPHESSDNRDYTFSYPTAVGISNQGDMYILDSDNIRILKFNLSGEFQFEIGGNDAGIYAVNNPSNFSIDRTGNIFVLDNKKIKLFDQYGNGISQLDLEDEIYRISISENNLVLITSNKIKIINLENLNLQNEWISIPGLEVKEFISDAELFNQNVFVLTGQRILKFSIVNSTR